MPYEMRILMLPPNLFRIHYGHFQNDGFDSDNFCVTSVTLLGQVHSGHCSLIRGGRDTVTLPERWCDTVTLPERWCDTVTLPERWRDTVTLPERWRDTVTLPERWRDTITLPGR